MHASHSCGFFTGCFVAMDEPNMAVTGNEDLYMLAIEKWRWLMFSPKLPWWQMHLRKDDLVPMRFFLHGFVEGFQTMRGKWLHCWDTMDTEELETVG